MILITKSFYPIDFLRRLFSNFYNILFKYIFIVIYYIQYQNLIIAIVFSRAITPCRSFNELSEQ